jgi:hypothetical protein
MLVCRNGRLTDEKGEDEVWAHRVYNCQRGVMGLGFLSKQNVLKDAGGITREW